MSADAEPDWSTVGYVKASPNREAIIGALAEREVASPSDLRDITDLHISHVSRTLSDLADESLVEVLNPDAKRGRLYRLTDHGRETAGALTADTNDTTSLKPASDIDPDWDVVGYVLRSRTRVDTLTKIDSLGRAQPSELTAELDWPFPTVSQALRDLQERGLVECLNPDAKRGRLYQITDAGGRMSTHVQEVTG